MRLIGNLELLDSFGHYPGTAHRHRQDTNLSAFVENELTQIIPATYDKVFVELDAREHIPLGVNIAPGAMAWAYDSIERRGRAKILGADAHDFPRADLSKRRVTFPIRTMVSSYGWTLEEIEAADFAGTPLNAEKATAARRAIAELEHHILIWGDINHGLPGFLTDPIIPISAVPNGNWLTTAVADEIIEDLNFIANGVWILSRRVHRANTILLPLEHFTHIANARIPDTNITILKFFLENNRFIQEVGTLIELEDAGPGGAARMLAYQKATDILSGVIPLAFQQLPAQTMGFEAVVPVREKIGGTIWFYPMAAGFGDGF